MYNKPEMKSMLMDGPMSGTGTTLTCKTPENNNLVRYFASPGWRVPGDAVGECMHKFRILVAWEDPCVFTARMKTLTHEKACECPRCPK